MGPEDLKALSRELAPVIVKFMGDAIAPITTRLQQAESRLAAIETRPAPKDGVGIAGLVKDDSGVLMLTLTDGKVLDTKIKDGVPGRDGVAGKDGADGRAGADGKDGRDGKDVSEEALAALIEARVGKALEAHPAPRDGKDADPEEVKRVVAEAVREAVDNLELLVGPKGDQGEAGPRGLPGEDGEDGAPGKDGAPGRDGAPGERGPEGPAGARGERGEAGLDGAPGIDGAAGRDGRDGPPGVPGRDGKDGLAGKDGAPGLDGLGFDDLSVDFDGERTLTVRFQKGEKVKEFPLVLRIPLYRGVFEARKHLAGDSVTYQGSLWIAKRDTEDKPYPSDDWQLAVKRGRDGKDGRVLPELPKTVQVGKPAAGRA